MTKNIIMYGDALSFYPSWASPDVIISDGAYGIGGFPGDPKNTKLLPDWYQPHVAAWSAAATASTWLWFWNTEVGWATMHPMLEEHGWHYVELVVWNKGVQHVAGNVNSLTIRQFPVVTEVAGLYMRTPVFLDTTTSQQVTMQEWLRTEWLRSGLPLNAANVACGVSNAATRKWLTSDHNWYMPPFEAYKKLADYANQHGDSAGKPYFQQDAQVQLTENRWRKLRGVWNHTHGVTNVWDVPSLRSSERIKTVAGKPVHANQKPLVLMERQVSATTDKGGVVWEPFGGLGSGSVAAKKLGRDSYAAEMNLEYHQLAVERLNGTAPLR